MQFMGKIVISSVLLVLCLSLVPLSADIENSGFESGNFEGWTADSNWVVVDNGCGWYSGWKGKYWAWSGGKGEPAVGTLKSKPFTLDKEAVRVMISGWASIHGTGKPRKWNYVTLNLLDGTEIDRVYAPNTTVFVPAYLDGSDHIGKQVYITAVDDADQPTFSMLCIDDVSTASLPASYRKPVTPLPAFNPEKSIKIEDDRYVVEVSRNNGVISRITDKKSGLELIREPRLANNFRFALPIPGKEPWQTVEANFIHGKQQQLSSFESTDKKLVLRWNGPLKNYRGQKFDASAAMTIELIDNGILFSFQIDNRSRYQIGEVYFPMIGGLQGLGKTGGQLKTTEFIRPIDVDAVNSSDIFRIFNNMSWLGDVGPEQFYQYPKDIKEPWIEFHSSKLNRSCYIGAHDPADRMKVVQMELYPHSSGTPREDGNWPRPEELKGLPVGVTLSFVDFANLDAGKTYEAAPVLVSFHDGDWHEGKKLYDHWKRGR